jgi:hypothetical protein
MEETTTITFADKWHAERMIKRAKKKARKELQTKGYSRSDATHLVKKASKKVDNSFISNTPIKRAARGG